MGLGLIYMEFKERFEEREDVVIEELRRLAEPHVEASEGLLSLLEHDEGRYPAQSLGTWHLDGSPQNVDIVDFIAKNIEPRFGEFTKVLEEREAKNKEISQIGELLKEKQNIILVTNHGDLKDIAYTLAAYYIGLKGLDYDFHSSLVMSKIISFIGVAEYGDEPGVNILKNVCDVEYFSFPRTRSIEQSKIARGFVKGYNLLVREAMERRLAKGGNLFAMAASGTTDKPIEETDGSVIGLGKLGDGTAKLMMTEKSLVVPVAVWITNQEVLFEPCSSPLQVKSEEDAAAVMKLIAATLSQRVEGKNFVYGV
jgi:hypothetical protein